MDGVWAAWHSIQKHHGRHYVTFVYHSISIGFKKNKHIEAGHDLGANGSRKGRIQEHPTHTSIPIFAISDPRINVLY